jgi:hypothetical protein
MKVTDSGNREDEDGRIVGDTDRGVALGVGVADGELISGEIAERVWVVVSWPPHPASATSKPTPVNRKASLMTVERKLLGPVSSR